MKQIAQFIMRYDEVMERKTICNSIAAILCCCFSIFPDISPIFFRNDSNIHSDEEQ